MQSSFHKPNHAKFLNKVFDDFHFLGNQKLKISVTSACMSVSAYMHYRFHKILKFICLINSKVGIHAAYYYDSIHAIYYHNRSIELYDLFKKFSESLKKIRIYSSSYPKN